MNARSTISIVALSIGAAACGGSAKASVNTPKEADDPSTFTETGAAPTATATAAPTASATAPAPAAPTGPPPADACPLQCFEANGSSRSDVTADEQTQLRTALEPVFATMRGCTSASDWQRHGSAVVNLRIGPDGTLADIGIDPGRANDNGCFDQAANGANVSLALPGRKIVRCVERCVGPAKARGNRTKKK